MSHDYKLKVMYGGVFKPVKTKLGRKYVYGMQTSYTVLSDTYTLKEFFEDMKKMWDWGETEYVQLVYKSKKIKGEAQRFIDIKGESDFLSMLEQFTDGTEIEIYITISPSGIPFDLGDEGVAEGDEHAIGDEGEEHSIGDEGVAEAEAEAEAEPETEAEALAEAGAETEASGEAEAEAEAEADFVESDGSDFQRDDFVESNLFYTTSEDDSNVDELVFDEDNPEMRYGVKYPDVTSFRSALNEFAIQNQFEYKVIKSDRGRVTARCRTKGCGWRIHAARIRGEDVFQVKSKIYYSTLIYIHYFTQRQVQDEPSAAGASAAAAGPSAAAAGPSAAAAEPSAAGALAEWTSAEWPSAEWASPAAGASAGASASASAAASAAGGQSSSQRRRKGSGTRRQQQHATAAPAASQTSLGRGQDLQAAASVASQQQHEAIPYSQQGSTISDIDARRLLG